MNAGQLAALIAAGFWAVLVCAAVYVLARIARLIAAATRAVTSYGDRAEEVAARTVLKHHKEEGHKKGQ